MTNTPKTPIRAGTCPAPCHPSRALPHLLPLPRGRPCLSVNSRRQQPTLSRTVAGCCLLRSRAPPPGPPLNRVSSHHCCSRAGGVTATSGTPGTNLCWGLFLPSQWSGVGGACSFTSAPHAGTNGGTGTQCWPEPRVGLEWPRPGQHLPSPGLICARSWASGEGSRGRGAVGTSVPARTLGVGCWCAWCWVSGRTEGTPVRTERSGSRVRSHTGSWGQNLAGLRGPSLELLNLTGTRDAGPILTVCSTGTEPTAFTLGCIPNSFYFETGSHYIVQTWLKALILPSHRITGVRCHTGTLRFVTKQATEAESILGHTGPTWLRANCPLGRWHGSQRCPVTEVPPLGRPAACPRPSRQSAN